MRPPGRSLETSALSKTNTQTRPDLYPKEYEAERFRERDDYKQVQVG